MAFEKAIHEGLKESKEDDIGRWKKSNFCYMAC